MRLNGIDGTFISVSPVGYEFPDTETSTIGEVDWLVIDGQMVSASERWSIRTTSLSALDAVSLGEWLRQAAQGSIPVSDPDEHGLVGPSLMFVEPALGFSVQSHSNSDVTIRVHLGYDAAPPSIVDDDRLAPYVCIVSVPVTTVLIAADVWTTEIQPFPHRGISW